MAQLLGCEIVRADPPSLEAKDELEPGVWAYSGDHYAAVEALLKRGANANARDMQGFDILTLAAVNNDLQLLKLALAGGADPRRVTGPLDGTALITAAHLGHVEIVRALIDAGEKNDTKAILEILGPEAKSFIETGDPVSDREARERFNKSYDEANKLVKTGDTKVFLQVGKDEWPLPIPLVKGSTG